MAAAVEEMALPVMKYTYSPGKLLCHLGVFKFIIQFLQMTPVS